MRAPGYPIVLSLEGRSCLVVGGGRVALRKITSLLEAGASVTVVAPEVIPQIRALDVEIVERPYRAADLVGRRLAVTATGDPIVDRAVFDDGEAAGILVNAADDPIHCAFTLPAVHRRGVVSLAVATDGASPALATWLRDRVAAALPGTLDALVDLVTHARDVVREAGVSTEGLSWHELIDALEEALTVDPDAARVMVAEFIAAAIGNSDLSGGDRGGTVVP